MNSDQQNLGLGNWSRRKFVQLGAASAVTMSAMSRIQANAQDAAATTHGTMTHESVTHESMIDVPFEKRNPRVAFIGTGGRGTNLLENLLAADGQVIALCDIVQEHAEHAASLVVKAGQAKPQLYTDGPYAFETMLAKNDIDLVLVATPWSWHAREA